MHCPLQSVRIGIGADRKARRQPRHQPHQIRRGPSARRRTPVNHDRDHNRMRPLPACTARSHRAPWRQERNILCKIHGQCAPERVAIMENGLLRQPIEARIGPDVDPVFHVGGLRTDRTVDFLAGRRHDHCLGPRRPVEPVAIGESACRIDQADLDCCLAVVVSQTDLGRPFLVEPVEHCAETI